MNAKTIKIASTLYDARDSARFIYGDRFFEKIAPSQEAIRKTMAMHGCDILPATMAIFTEINKQDPYGSGKAQVVLLAAAVEMMEPSEKPKLQTV